MPSTMPKFGMIADVDFRLLLLGGGAGVGVRLRIDLFLELFHSLPLLVVLFVVTVEAVFVRELSLLLVLSLLVFRLACLAWSGLAKSSIALPVSSLVPWPRVLRTVSLSMPNAFFTADMVV